MLSVDFDAGSDERRAAAARALFGSGRRSAARRLLAARARAALGREATPADVTLALADAVYPAPGEPGVSPDVAAHLGALRAAAARGPRELAVFAGGACVAALRLAPFGDEGGPAPAFPARRCVDATGADVDGGAGPAALTVAVGGPAGLARFDIWRPASDPRAAAEAGAVLLGAFAGACAAARRGAASPGVARVVAARPGTEDELFVGLARARDLLLELAAPR